MNGKVAKRSIRSMNEAIEVLADQVEEENWVSHALLVPQGIFHFHCEMCLRKQRYFIHACMKGETLITQVGICSRTSLKIWRN